MIRVGIGYDVHALAENRPLIIGGVRIPYSRGLLGHSDADVLLHALMDAMLGAAALGDIGKHFPPDDPSFEGISSMLLLDMTRKILEGKGYTCANLDCTVIAQEPRLAPFMGAIRQNIARALGLEEDYVSVKATTTEGLGFAGRKEGIAACAVCTIRKLSLNESEG
jgi:2-C-methyl-D-erythritol 2,4-cyclodiphosphate synthase